MSLKPIRLKSLLLYVVVTLLFGIVGTLLGGDTGEIYATLIKPPLSPPGILFPIVWTILYILMGIGAYILSTENSLKTDFLLKIYWAQLTLNALWPLVFWRFEAYTFAAVIIAVILVLTVYLTIKSFKINKTASYLFIPYIIWLLFALYLNIAIAILN